MGRLSCQAGQVIQEPACLLSEQNLPRSRLLQGDAKGVVGWLVGQVLAGLDQDGNSSAGKSVSLRQSLKGPLKPACGQDRG